MSGMTWRGDVAPSDLSNRSRTKFLGWILVQVLRTVKFPCISCHGDNSKSALQLCIPFIPQFRNSFRAYCTLPSPVIALLVLGGIFSNCSRVA